MHVTIIKRIFAAKGSDDAHETEDEAYEDCAQTWLTRICNLQQTAHDCRGSVVGCKNCAYSGGNRAMVATIIAALKRQDAREREAAVSYTRFGDGSDEDVVGGFTCCWCRLNNHHEVNVATRQEMVAHLREHIAAGHEVPPGTIEQLEDEAARDCGQEGTNSK